jgi:hypothetical protein
MHFLARDLLTQLPSKKSIRVVGVVLHIATRGHVKDDSIFTVLFKTFSRKLYTELCFADSGGPDNHGQLARQQSAAKHFVQSRNSS